jgi:aspartate aminotransferase
MNKNDDLDRLRNEIRDITADIIHKVKKRMEVSKQIGEIKTKNNIDVEDEKVESDLRNSALKIADEVGIDPEFSGRLLNILLTESVRLQNKQQNDNSQKQTHLSIFMKAKHLQATGKNIIHLEVGEPDYLPPKIVKNTLGTIYDLRQYHYTETRGIPKLRHAIAQKVGNGINDEQVIVTPGGRFAVFSAILSLVKSGDEVIYIEPAWPAYRECADFIGAKTKIIKTTLEEKWNPDLKRFEDLINSNTKMIILNYPNNPTGKILDDNSMRKIIGISKDYGIYILSDEVYSDYSFNGFKSILDYGYDKSIMISSFSKGHAMTGFRVGYGISSENIIARMSKIQSIALTSVAEPMQYSALSAIGENISGNVEVMKRRLRFVCDKLQKMSLSFVPPDGALYVYPKLGKDTDDDTILIDKLLDLGVAIAPGSGFGDSYKRFMRISACQSEEVLEKGLQLLSSAL